MSSNEIECLRVLLFTRQIAADGLFQLHDDLLMVRHAGWECDSYWFR